MTGWLAPSTLFIINVTKGKVLPMDDKSKAADGKRKKSVTVRNGVRLVRWD